MTARGQLWAIIYGADEDQYPQLNDAHVFRDTLSRVAKVVSEKRIVVSMTPEVHALWGEELGRLPVQNRIEAPYERGVPAGALLAFFQLFRKEPTSRVLLIPANHRVREEKVLLDALELAASSTPGDDNCAVLIGMRERDALLPGDLLHVSESEAKKDHTHKVVRIDPTPQLDMRHFAVERGALISTGIVAAGSSAMLRLYDHALPGMLRSFLATLRGRAIWSPETLGRLFRFLPKRQLGRDLLTPSSELLRVLPVGACGYQNLEHGDRLAPKVLLAEPHATLPLLSGRRPALELLPS